MCIFTLLKLRTTTSLVLYYYGIFVQMLICEIIFCCRIFWAILLLLSSSNATLGLASFTTAKALQNLIGTFLQHIQNYFPGCTMIILHDPSITFDFAVTQNSTLIGGNLDKSSSFSEIHQDSNNILDFVLQLVQDMPFIIFSLTDELQEMLIRKDINSITRCPFYITIAPNITAALGLFLMANKDWDKYFMSRKQVILTQSSVRDIESFFQEGEINLMTNVLLIQPALRPLGLRLLTNTPYSPGRSDRVKSLKTWRGEPMPREHELFPDKLVDLHGHPMRVVTFHFPPRIFMEEDSDGNYNLYGVDIEASRKITVIN